MRDSEMSASQVKLIDGTFAVKRMFFRILVMRENISLAIRSMLEDARKYLADLGTKHGTTAPATTGIAPKMTTPGDLLDKIIPNILLPGLVNRRAVRRSWIVRH